METCSLTYLEDLFVRIFETKLKTSLSKKKEGLNNVGLYMLIREQTHVMLFLEIFVRRLEADTIKNRVTKVLYG